MILKKIINELRYQINKRDIVFYYNYLRKVRTHTAPISQSILIIRLDAIGDAIIWLDQAKEYRKAFPQHRIVLLHNKSWELIAQKLPYIDQCISYDRNNGALRYKKQILRQVNMYTYEKVFCPTYSREFMCEDWFMHNVHAKEKIAFSRNYNKTLHLPFFYQGRKQIELNEIVEGWYTQLVEKNSQEEMELQINAEFTRNVIDPLFKSCLPVIPYQTSCPNWFNVTEYVVLFLGASRKERTWPPERFAEITNRFSSNTYVICGGLGDKDLVDIFLEYINNSVKVINLVGKTNLNELISIIQKAKYIITNETSASHIAVATRTPSVCILGGGHFGRFHPYNIDSLTLDEKTILPHVVFTSDNTCFKCEWNCKYNLQNGRWKCIDDIQLEDVLSVIPCE